ncbi:MAG: NAD-dependent epimerase/dehydratase family protein [Marinilabiliaceae bacterium]|jgi:nucleoside-diphosphate-sugar epimerase|nr:NAD-dependent epimerase/dehydratase family protein [Marinilabiliaceae bacterium]
MRILVTGATGFLGGNMLKMLAKRFGIGNIIGTGRNIVQSEILRAEGYNIYPGDLCSVDFVKSQFKNIDCLVHCAAKSSLWGKYEDFYQDNVVATLNLLEYIKDLKSFVYISTPSIYFEYKDKYMISEDSKLPSRFVNHYTATKYMAEKEVLNFVKPGMVKTVLRPRAIVGAGDTVIIPRLIKAYKAGKLRIIGPGSNISDFSSVKNVAHAAYLALTTDNDIDGKIFNITDGQALPMWSMIEDTLNKLGLDSKLKRVPYRPVKIIAGFYELINRLILKEEPVLTSYGVGLLRFSCTLDISQARKLLGYEPIISTEESIGEFIKQYLKNE